jgi:hypothetical protein
MIYLVDAMRQGTQILKGLPPGLDIIEEDLCKEKVSLV